MFGIIDGNNFFTSVEQLFRPDLRGKPVIVLSNNDGCVIARSNEAKALGIAMGVPAFQIEQIIKRYNVSVFSANFILYGDISNRMVNITRRFFRDVFQYSVDESFFSLHKYNFINLKSHCNELRDTIFYGLDIPCSIGLAETKTLAKVANKIVKKYSADLGHTYIIDSKEKLEKALRWLPLSDVWGIGRGYNEKFTKMGLRKAWDFIQLPEALVQKEMGIYGLRMHKELRGIPQYDLGEHKSKKGIGTSRTFDKRTDNIEVLKERISTFAFKCSEKLRKQNSCCNFLTVYITTDRFKPDLKQYNNSITIGLANPSSSAIELAGIATKALEKIYLPFFQYKKAGVMLTSFVPDTERLISLFEKDLHDKHKPLMSVIDHINKKLGADKVKLGSMDIQTTWKMNQKNLSPCRSTDIKQALRVKAL